MPGNNGLIPLKQLGELGQGQPHGRVIRLDVPEIDTHNGSAVASLLVLGLPAVWRRAVTPYFDYLFVSPAELRKLARGTGWRVRQVLPSRGPMYVAVLERTPGA